MNPVYQSTTHIATEADAKQLKAEAETKVAKSHRKIVVREGCALCLPSTPMVRPELYQLRTLCTFLEKETQVEIEKEAEEGNLLEWVELIHPIIGEETQSEEVDVEKVKKESFAVLDKELGIKESNKFEKEILHYARLFQRYMVDGQGNVFCGVEGELDEEHAEEPLYPIALLIDMVRKGMQLDFTKAEGLSKGKRDFFYGSYNVIFVKGPERMHIVPMSIKHEIGDGGFSTVYSMLEVVSAKNRVLKYIHIKKSENEEVTDEEDSKQLAERNAKHEALLQDADDESATLRTLSTLDPVAPSHQAHYYADIRLKEEDDPGIILGLTHLYRGGTVRNWLESNPTYAERLDFVQFLFETLVKWRKFGFAHRDLKPENIFVEMQSERPFRIGDVGSGVWLNNLEKWLETHSFRVGITYNFACKASLEAFTIYKENLGTKKFDLEKAKNAFLAYDLYSVSLIAFYVLSNGKHAYDFATEGHRGININSKLKVNLLQAHPYSQEMIGLLAKHLQHDPKNRPENAEAMVKLLSSIDRKPLLDKRPKGK